MAKKVSKKKTTKKKTTKKKAGRPTKYKPEYCELLIKHMSEGLSFESFGGTVNVHDGTLFEWCEAYPDFKEAKRVGKYKCMQLYEKIGVGQAAGQIQGSTGAWVFNMKNRFGWRDVKEHEHSGSGGGHIKLSYKVDEDKEE